jgi:hypothetical protein
MMFWDDLNYLFSPDGHLRTGRSRRHNSRTFSNIHHEDVAVTVLSLLGQTANDLPGRDRSRSSAKTEA